MCQFIIPLFSIWISESAVAGEHIYLSAIMAGREKNKSVEKKFQTIPVHKCVPIHLLKNPLIIHLIHVCTVSDNWLGGWKEIGPVYHAWNLLMSFTWYVNRYDNCCGCCAKSWHWHVKKNNNKIVEISPLTSTLNKSVADMLVFLKLYPLIVAFNVVERQKNKSCYDACYTSYKTVACSPAYPFSLSEKTNCKNLSLYGYKALTLETSVVVKTT